MESNIKTLKVLDSVQMPWSVSLCYCSVNTLHHNFSAWIPVDITPLSCKYAVHNTVVFYRAQFQNYLVQEQFDCQYVWLCKTTKMASLNVFITLIMLILTHTLHEDVASAEKNLTFMLITSFGEFGFNSSGAVPAADLALDDINKKNDLLPGYRLVYDKPRNSQVQLPCHSFSYNSTSCVLPWWGKKGCHMIWYSLLRHVLNVFSMF